jgi:hypothetical protein
MVVLLVLIKFLEEILLSLNVLSVYDVIAIGFIHV